MGVVYASDSDGRQFDRTVALKLLSERCGNQSVAQQRFVQEAKIRLRSQPSAHHHHLLMTSVLRMASITSPWN